MPREMTERESFTLQMKEAWERLCKELYIKSASELYDKLKERGELELGTLGNFLSNVEIKNGNEET